MSAQSAAQNKAAFIVGVRSRRRTSNCSKNQIKKEWEHPEQYIAG